jgi:microcompartment protein CcmL/EutN
VHVIPRPHEEVETILPPSPIDEGSDAGSRGKK